jgi:hypothetical protein|tara:strand:- start:1066 stop:1545 length:480 start_codon:yes stop_codon:yes gene_type:complete
MAFSQNIARLRDLLQNFEVGEVKLLKDMSYQKAVLSVGSAKTLDPSESGRLVWLESSSGAFSLTLPSVAAGLHYRMMVTEHTPTGAITIAAGSAIIFGKINETEVDTGDDGPGSNGNTGVSNLIIGVSAVRGDWVEFYSDGTSWYIHGSSAADGAFTTS